MNCTLDYALRPVSSYIENSIPDYEKYLPEAKRIVELSDKVNGSELEKKIEEMNLPKETILLAIDIGVGVGAKLSKGFLLKRGILPHEIRRMAESYLRNKSSKYRYFSMH